MPTIRAFGECTANELRGILWNGHAACAITSSSIARRRNALRTDGIAEIEWPTVDRNAVDASNEIVGMQLCGSLEHRIGRGKATNVQRMLVEVQCSVRGTKEKKISFSQAVTGLWGGYAKCA